MRKLTFILLLVVAAAAVAQDDPMTWNKTPEAYFMTAAERAEWAKVASPEDARKFIDEYRRKRGEQFLKDIRTRIDLADEQFKIDKTPGSRTQRGRVWLILGNPSRSATRRGGPDDSPLGGGGRPGFSGPPGTTQPVTGGLPMTQIEAKGLFITQWTYDKDRLDQSLGRKSLVVTFQTDSSRGYEVIDNVGQVEPYLTAAVESISNKYIAAAQSQTAQRAVVPSPGSIPVAGPDPLWNATPSLNGASFNGDAYLSPTEEPFYAYSFYVPKGAAAFGDWKSALVVTLIKDAAGQQIVSNREQVELSAYDDLGNRYLDRSVALSPGRYEGLFAVYSPDGATLLASHRTSFEVAPKDATRASALMLTSRIDMLPTQQALDPFTFVATKYAVRGDRKFLPTDKLAFFTVISNPGGSPSPNLLQKMTFRLNGQDFARTSFEPAQLTQTGPNTFLIGTAFDPDTFKPGHYTLELQVRDMNAPEGSELRTKGWVLKSEFDVLGVR